MIQYNRDRVTRLMELLLDAMVFDWIERGTLSVQEVRDECIKTLSESMSLGQDRITEIIEERRHETR